MILYNNRFGPILKLVRVLYVHVCQQFPVSYEENLPNFLELDRKLVKRGLPKAKLQQMEGIKLSLLKNEFVHQDVLELMLGILTILMSAAIYQMFRILSWCTFYK